MRVLSLPIIAVLSGSAGLSLVAALPAAGPACLATRGQLLSDSPTTEARAMPENRTGGPIPGRIAPRKSTCTVLWQEEDRDKHIIVTPSRLGVNDRMEELVAKTYGMIESNIASVGDGVVSTGHIVTEEAEYGLHMRGINNVALTWKVAAAGVSTLWDYFNHNGFRMASFTIVKDAGCVPVGEGIIGHLAFLPGTVSSELDH
ncbi:hypothetical protein MMC24_003918 [Lignoscripta atroalba]|nr:hypothetical protein [Lignoscripta atroalba]